MDDLEPETETEMVTIRCPGCGQRFKVGSDLEGRMVECGSCDHRFRVEEGVIMRTKKFYPGEHRDPLLQRFSRVPLKSGPMPDFDAVTPPPEPDPRAMVDPVSPLRVILGLGAVTGAVIVALVMMFGGAPGGMLDGSGMGERLILAGFTSLIAWVMLFFANPTQRFKAMLGGLLITALLVSMPFLFKQGLPSGDAMAGIADGGPTPGTLDPAADEAPDADPFADVKKEMGYDKVAEALATYGADGESRGKTAVGVWFRDTRLYNKEQIVDYLMRTTGAGERSWAYSRPPADYLMVLYDVSPDLSRIARLCERFGMVQRVIRELNVIEVRVDNERFIQGPADKLQNPEDPSFYALNRRELDSIDTQRAAAAVKRLALAEPRLFRTDIVARMLELFSEGDLDMKRDIARALQVWAEPGDGAVEVVREEVRTRREAGEEVPRPMVELLVSNRDEQAVPIIHGLWLADTGEWEPLYGDLGEMIEDRLLEDFADLGPRQQMSAARLLGRAGTARSLPVLEAAKDGAVSELRVNLEQAIRAIGSRS